MSEDPQSPFHTTVVVCNITAVYSPGKKKMLFEMMSCESTDADGDQAFSFGVAEVPKNVVAHFVGGTGKFEGITGVYDTNYKAGTEWGDGSIVFPYKIEWYKIPEKSVE